MAGRTIAIVLMAVALIGCREDEQNRPLSYEPGVYQGGAVPVITDETRVSLRERAQNQAF